MASVRCAVCDRPTCACGPDEKEDGYLYPKHFLDTFGRVRRSQLVMEEVMVEIG
jgi:hypothetical protein